MTKSKTFKLSWMAEGKRSICLCEIIKILNLPFSPIFSTAKQPKQLPPLRPNNWLFLNAQRSRHFTSWRELRDVRYTQANKHTGTHSQTKNERQLENSNGFLFFFSSFLKSCNWTWIRVWIEFRAIYYGGWKKLR